MSSILETLAAEVGPSVLSQLGESAGATPQQTQSVFASALPALIGGLSKNTQSEGGAQALAGALDRDHGPGLMDQLGPLAGQLLGGSGGGGGSDLASLAGAAMSMFGGGGQSPQGAGGLVALLGAASALGGGQAPKAANGAGILGHIFGARQNDVTSNIAQASGVDQGVVMKLLPMLAPLVMSALGTLKKNQGLDAGGVANLLSNEANSMQAPKDDGFGADDLMRIGGALAQSGLLQNLF
jgi:hypothetical protein